MIRRDFLAFLPSIIIIACITIWSDDSRKPTPAWEGCIENLGVVQTASEMYSTDYDGHYPDSFQQLVPKYLPAPPRCPKTGLVYKLSTGTDSPFNPRGFLDFYYIHCRGAAHVNEGLPTDHPGLNGIESICFVRQY